MTTVSVKLVSGGYDVLIGPVEAGFAQIADLARGEAPMLVTEPRVFGLHGQQIAERLGAGPILLPEGEAAKDWTVLHRLLALDPLERGLVAWFLVAVAGREDARDVDGGDEAG